ASAGSAAGLAHSAALAIGDAHRVHRARDSPRGRASIETHSLAVILAHSRAVIEAPPEVELRLDEALPRRLAQPVRDLALVAPHALPDVVEVREVVLRLGVAELGRAPEEPHRLAQPLRLAPVQVARELVQRARVSAPRPFAALRTLPPSPERAHGELRVRVGRRSSFASSARAFS